MLSIVHEQAARIASNSGRALSTGLVVGLLVSLWSAMSGVKAIIDALMSRVARGPHQCRCCSATAIQEDLDARSASGGSLAERPGAALPQSREHALDMLARPQAIRAMIDAAAGIVEAIEVADFHLVEAAAPRLHTERAEKWLMGFQRLDGDDFRAAPPAAQRDLILVGGPPA